MDNSDAKVDVVLKTYHEHEGKAKNVGDIISVYPDTANWLFAQDIAEKSVPKPVKIGRSGDSK